MSSKELEEEKSGRSSREVLCARCEHPNSFHANSCEKCHSHLFLACKECGQKNERTRTRCAHCESRLHRSALTRYRRKLMASGLPLTLAKIGLFGLALLIAYNLIRLVGSFRLPEL